MSPIIILGLVVMWGVVLVPMWLRRHDEAEESRSVDRFSTAMHTLSRHDAARRDARSDRRYVVMPHRTRAVDVHVSGAAAADSSRRSTRRRDAAAGQRRTLLGLSVRLVRLLVAPLAWLLGRLLARPVGGVRRPLSAADRRRRTLTALAFVTVLTLVLAVAVGGLALWVPQIGLDLCLAAFLRQLRQRARRAAIVSRQRGRATVAPAQRPGRDVAADAGVRTAGVRTAELPVWQRYAAAAARTAATEATAAQAAAAQPTADEGVEQATATASAQVAGGAGIDIVMPDTDIDAATPPEVATATGGEWAPVPVPPPTYSMKPAAPARRRRKSPLAEPSDVSAAAESAQSIDPAESSESKPAPTAASSAARPKPSAKPRKRTATARGVDDELAELDAILEHRRAVND